MKRILIGSALVLALVFAFGGAALAAPQAANQGFFVFGEFAPLLTIEPPNFPMLGVGYAFTDSFAAGLEVQDFYVDNSAISYGGFATYGTGNIVLAGDVMSTGTGGWLGNVSGSYTFDLGDTKLGIGPGATIVFENPVETMYFVQGEASTAVSDGLSIFGNFRCYVASPLELSTMIDCTVGATYSLY